MARGTPGPVKVMKSLKKRKKRHCLFFQKKIIGPPGHPDGRRFATSVPLKQNPNQEDHG
jgi:hypothetical protein